MDDGRYEGLVYLPISPNNNFTPALPEQKIDLIYLCYPKQPNRGCREPRSAKAMGRLRP